jgi:DNA-binding CsgD family transcriptional regulator
MDVTVAADCSKDLSIDNIGIVQVSVGCEGSQQAKNIDNFDKATDSINACSLIAKQYQLSKRETDVLVLLSKGYSSTKIQSELYISAGTVNYHTRNIYTKLDVHSKQEVIGMVEAAGVV